MPVHVLPAPNQKAAFRSRLFVWIVATRHFDAPVLYGVTFESTFRIQATRHTSLSSQRHTWNARVFMAMTAFKGISMTMTATPARTDGPRFCEAEQTVPPLSRTRLRSLGQCCGGRWCLAVRTYLPEEIQSQNDLKGSGPQHVEEGGQIHEPLGVHGHEVDDLPHGGRALGSVCYHQRLRTGQRGAKRMKPSPESISRWHWCTCAARRRRPSCRWRR